MSLTNAVFIRYRGGFRWVEDLASIAEWGRIESLISVGDLTDLAVIDELGAQYLATRSQPRTAYVATVQPTGDGDIAGDDYDLFDTVTAEGHDGIPVVGVTHKLDGLGRLVPLPELGSPLYESETQAGRKLARMVAEAGGSTGDSATPIDTGSGVPTGKIGQIAIPPWSWNRASELSAGGGFPRYPVQQPMRLHKWRIECRVDAGGTGFEAPTGDSVFVLHKNGAPISPPFVITLGPSETTAEQPIFGPAFMTEPETLYPVCTTNGGHHSGSITVTAVDPT